MSSIACEGIGRWRRRIADFTAHCKLRILRGESSWTVGAKGRYSAEARRAPWCHALALTIGIGTKAMCAVELSAVLDLTARRGSSPRRRRIDYKSAAKADRSCSSPGPRDCPIHAPAAVRIGSFRVAELQHELAIGIRRAGSHLQFSPFLRSPCSECCLEGGWGVGYEEGSTCGGCNFSGVDRRPSWLCGGPICSANVKGASYGGADF